jgi:enoyl-CoA hydratase
MAKPSILVEREPPVTTLVIDRPEVRNALDRAASVQLARALRAFDADANAKVAVLTGAGGAFCSGADLRELAQGEIYEALRNEADRSREARERDAVAGAARFVAGRR